MKSCKADVDDFLSDLCELINCGRWEAADRKKNTDTLARLGWKWKDAVDALLDLSYSDYVCGPVIDRNFPESDFVWIFKKTIENELIYIKLIIMTNTSGNLFIFSFHVDGW